MTVNSKRRDSAARAGGAACRRCRSVRRPLALGQLLCGARRKHRWSMHCSAANSASANGDASNWPVPVAARAPVSRSWLEGT